MNNFIKLTSFLDNTIRIYVSVEKISILVVEKDKGTVMDVGTGMTFSVAETPEEIFKLAEGCLEIDPMMNPAR